MTWWLFACAALLLAIERIAYILIWHHPERFREWCTEGVVARLIHSAGLAATPVDAVRAVFAICKVIQFVVFAGWILVHSGGTLQRPDGGAVVLVAGATLLMVGQILNFSVFLRLGTTGVFYGTRFGHAVPWCETFPFSVLSHPQYVGTVLSIWGLFLIARFPERDWLLLPALETVYYTLGAQLEK